MASSVQTLISPAELWQVRSAWQAAREAVAFVPTMGALHQGHASLIKKAHELGNRVIVSIFVNPTQFGPNEDFSKYPRTLKADLEILSSLKVDAVFVPNAADIYPEGFQTRVYNDTMAKSLCGASRPGHFEGVLTVVLKLLNLVQPRFAIFGKKDYQQWRLIDRMARDFTLPVEIVGVDTVRETDGLAMSSRNRYLNPDERASATALSRGLMATAQLFQKGNRQVEELMQAFDVVLQTSPMLQVEYAEIRQQSDLSAFKAKIDAPAVMLAAIKLGNVRLIDNLELV